MAQKKYAEYVNELLYAREIINKAHVGKITEVMEFDKRVFKGATHHIEAFIVYAPGAGFAYDGALLSTVGGRELRDLPMVLPFDEFSLYIGTDPQDPTDLGGEVEYWLGEGEAAEKYIITRSSCIFIPAGLVHGPIYFRKVDRPFLHMVIITTPEPPVSYMKTAGTLPPGFSLDKYL
jgi:hypothetical protein